MEVGIDIEQNERFRNISQRVIERAFTKSEIEYAEKHINKITYPLTKIIPVFLSSLSNPKAQSESM